MKLCFTIIKKGSQINAPFEVLNDDEAPTPCMDRHAGDLQICQCVVQVPKESTGIVDVLQHLDDIVMPAAILEDACIAPWIDDKRRRIATEWVCAIWEPTPTKRSCSVLPPNTKIAEGDYSITWRGPLVMPGPERHLMRALCRHKEFKKELLTLLEEIVLQSYLAKDKATVLT